MYVSPNYRTKKALREGLARLLEKLVSGVNAYAARLETADDDWSPPTN